MCFQLIERYGVCGCLYYNHAVDCCPRYGAPEHGIVRRTILVGTTCIQHSSLNDPSGNHSFVGSGYTYPSDGAELGGLRDHTPHLQTTVGGPETNPAKPGRSHVKGNVSQTKSATSIHGKLQEQAPPLPAEYTEANGHISNDRSSKPISGQGKSFSTENIDSQCDKEDCTKPESEIDHATGATEAVPEEHTKQSRVHESSRRGGEVKRDGAVLGRRNHEEFLADESTAEIPDILSPAEPFTYAGGINPTDTVFRRLLVFQDLRYLWPQIVLRCGSRRVGVATIGELLHLYSKDLSILASSTEYLNPNHSSRDRSAYELMEKSRFKVARRIWKAHHEGSLELQENSKAINAGQNLMKNPIPDKCDVFLYGSEPIMALQARAKNLVRCQDPTIDGFAHRLFGLAKVQFSNVTSLVYQPPLKPGSRRIWWKCVCGQKLYDDYTELRPGGIVRLEELLKQYCSVSPLVSLAASASTSNPKPTWGLSIISACMEFCSSIWTSRKTSKVLPSHKASNAPASELGVCSTTQGAS